MNIYWTPTVCPAVCWLPGAESQYCECNFHPLVVGRNSILQPGFGTSFSECENSHRCLWRGLLREKSLYNITRNLGLHLSNILQRSATTLLDQPEEVMLFYSTFAIGSRPQTNQHTQLTPVLCSFLFWVFYFYLSIYFKRCFKMWISFKVFI